MKNRSIKKITALLVALMLALAVCPAPVKAAGTICPCCQQSMSGINWSTLPATKVIPSGHYRLTGDAAMTQYQTVEEAVTLDLNGHTLTTCENKRAFYVSSGTMHVLDSVGTGVIVGNGVSADNGGIFRVRAGATLNIYSGTFSGGKVGSDTVGGNIRVEGTFNMYGGRITGGQTTDDHGGNFSVSSGIVNMYGGTVENGQTFGSGRGGNFYLTGSATRLNIYGGTVTGGISAGKGGNIFAYSGAAACIYGGTVSGGVAATGSNDIYIIGSKDDRFSSLDIYGGTVGSGESSLLRYADTNPIRIYNGTVGQDPAAFLASCACYTKAGDSYTVWNPGHVENTCDGTCPYEQNFAHIEKALTGTHAYAPTHIRNTYGCSVCGNTYHNENVVAVTEKGIYTNLSDAIDVGGDIWLLDDAQEEEVLLDGVTLDLNGHKLTASAVSASTGNIIDTTGGSGLLVCGSVALAGDNENIPLDVDGDLQFSSLTPEVTLERLTEDTVRVRFVFTEKAADTIIDDAVLAGNEDISIRLYLTWTDQNGTAKEKTYTCDRALLEKYAQKWDGRRFVATITGVQTVTDLTCTVQVYSRAASGVTHSATTLKNVAYINEKLSWDDINSFPVKTADMTVAEMRDLCVAFFEYSKTFLWTPDESVSYIRNSSGRQDAMIQGTVYGGLPYVGNASSSPYRMMDYVNPETGLVDMKKALPALGTDDILSMADLLYFGSQCAKTASLGWGRVINSADYRRTGNLLPYHGSILLGDIVMDETKTTWTEDYRTTQVCQENGTEVMYEAYAQLQKADGLVYYTTAGHVIMAYEDAVVVRNADGTVNGNESYLRVIDQAQTWETDTNASGDSFLRKNGIGTKKTFAELYSGSYIPFTFAEFVEGDPIEETTLAITNADGTVLLSGTVRETDREFVTETAAEELTFTELCGATVTSNYGISDVYIIIYNTAGKELYRHAVRSSSAGIPTLKLAETGDQVTTWEYGEVRSGGTYHAEVVVQLYTGERPTVYSGDLTV